MPSNSDVVKAPPNVIDLTLDDSDDDVKEDHAPPFASEESLRTVWHARQHRLTDKTEEETVPDAGQAISGWQTRKRPHQPPAASAGADGYSLPQRPSDGTVEGAVKTTNVRVIQNGSNGLPRSTTVHSGHRPPSAGTTSLITSHETASRNHSLVPQRPLPELLPEPNLASTISQLSSVLASPKDSESNAKASNSISARGASALTDLEPGPTQQGRTSSPIRLHNSGNPVPSRLSPDFKSSSTIPDTTSTISPANVDTSSKKSETRNTIRDAPKHAPVRPSSGSADSEQRQTNNSEANPLLQYATPSELTHSSTIAGVKRDRDGSAKYRLPVLDADRSDWIDHATQSEPDPLIDSSKPVGKVYPWMASPNTIARQTTPWGSATASTTNEYDVPIPPPKTQASNSEVEVGGYINGIPVVTVDSSDEESTARGEPVSAVTRTERNVNGNRYLPSTGDFDAKEPLANYGGIFGRPRCKKEPSRQDGIVRVNLENADLVSSHLAPSAERLESNNSSQIPRARASNMDQHTADLVRQAHQSQRRSSGGTTMPWTPEENALLRHAKENLGLGWVAIHQNLFPYRATWYALQSQYSKRLAQRPNGGADVVPISTRRLSGSRRYSTALANRESEFDLSDDEDFTEHRSFASTRANSPRTGTLEKTSLPKKSDRNGDVLGVSKAMSPLAEVDSGSTWLERQRRRMRAFAEKERDAAALAGHTSSVRRSSWRPYIGEYERGDLVKQWKRSGPLKRKIRIDRPYLSAAQRHFLNSVSSMRIWDEEKMLEWNGKALHVDFTDEELTGLEECIADTLKINATRTLGPSPASRVRDYMTTVDDATMSTISWYAQNQDELHGRSRDDIEALLSDCRDGLLSSVTNIQRITIPHFKCPKKLALLGPCLRNREIGSTGPRRRPVEAPRLTREIQRAVSFTLGPNMSFTGTSGDVNTVAWSPDGETFAVGSAALTDDNSMQYNLTNNLLFGDVNSRALYELPFHATKRKRTASGANSSEEMFNSQDRLLFQSVSAVQFTADGQTMLSAGYDNIVRLWDTRYSPREPRCVREIKHEAPVDLLAVNSEGLFASGSQKCDNSIRVFRYDVSTPDETRFERFSFSSPRAQRYPEKEIVPTCLKWGNSLWGQQKYLLCGFSSRLKDYGEGESCIWDIGVEQPIAIVRGSLNIFDVAWSPTIFGRFAAASSPTTTVNKGTRSVVRIFDSRLLCRDSSSRGELKVDAHRQCEMECPALDINDILFNPSDDFLISAGCTNGMIYTWDVRQPSRILHRFKHGQPLMELGDNTTYGHESFGERDTPRERIDTGVRFMSYGATRRELYTGSSDGTLALWDPYISTSDAHIADVAHLKSGIMSGAFSNDFSNLLLGEVNGTVSALAVGQEDKQVGEYGAFRFREATNETLRAVSKNLNIDPAEMSSKESTGRLTATNLINSGEIELKPFGDLPIRQAVQGPRYSGPFDNSDDAETLRTASIRFQRRFQRPLDPCTLDHSVSRQTEEDCTDAMIWKTRIPEVIHFPPNENGASTYSKNRQFKQNLACFRCECPLSRSEATQEDVLRCLNCQLAWRFDILGYMQIHWETLEPLTPRQSTGTSELVGRSGASQTHAEVLEEVTDGFETLHCASEDVRSLQNVEDYYHTLWHDRPPSPL